jgi:hypothetical protein
MFRPIMAALALLVAGTVPALAGFDVFMNELPGPIPIGVGPGSVFVPEPSMGPGEGTSLAYIGSFANYGAGPGLISLFPNQTTPILLGGADGQLFVSFTSPVTDFQFDIGLLTAFNQSLDYTVGIFTVGSVTPTVAIPRDITATGFLPYETFIYSAGTPVVTGFVLSFPTNVAQFAVDNIIAVPEASTTMMMAAAAAMLGMVRFARRSNG